jgi:hypothetical protein
VTAKQRFNWYSYERASVGTFGPFGPIEARDESEARRIAAARAARSGLHLDRVEPCYKPSGTSTTPSRSNRL